jgi:hypothetical protein
MAQAAVMAALCAATAIIAVVVPFAAGLSLLGTVPMGLLAYRYRIKVLVAATVAAGVIAFLIAGVGGLMTVVNCAYIGGLTGIVKRRGRGAPTVVAASFVAGVVFGVASVLALILLARLRHLIFDSMTANVNGLARVISQVPQFRPAAEDFKNFFAAALSHWQWLILGYAVMGIMFVSLIGWWALSRVLERLLGIPDVHKLEATHDTEPPGPVPVRLHDVRFRYPNAAHDALSPTSLTVEAGEHVAITGANGSGKTTLMLILAGRRPTSGVVQRPGAVALGHSGGTAVILQHPESQVLGTRVADDVVWGLPPGTTVDVPSLLDEVGLAEMGKRDTGGLSGGESWSARRARRAGPRDQAGRPCWSPRRRSAVRDSGPGRRRAAATRRRRRPGQESRTADRRRGDQHGRPAWSRGPARRALRADQEPPNVVDTHHALQQ